MQVILVLNIDTKKGLLIKQPFSIKFNKNYFLNAGKSSVVGVTNALFTPPNVNVAVI